MVKSVNSMFLLLVMKIDAVTCRTKVTIVKRMTLQGRRAQSSLVILHEQHICHAASEVKFCVEIVRVELNSELASFMVDLKAN